MLSVDIFSSHLEQIEWGRRDNNDDDDDGAEKTNNNAEPSDDMPDEQPTGRPRCERCRRPVRVCVCHCLPPAPIHTSTHVVVLQTRAESRARVGTAALLPLVLANASVAVLRSRRADNILPALRNINACDDAAAAAAAAPAAATATVLLFPGRGSVALDTYPHPVRTLVVLDGSWEGACNVLQNSPAIRSLPRVRLPDHDGLSSPSSSPPLFQARRPPVNIPGS
jgi:DTW domain-containing protein YfiP